MKQENNKSSAIAFSELPSDIQKPAKEAIKKLAGTAMELTTANDWGEVYKASYSHY
ncbi:hypothetical protein O0535_12015 [Brevibacillus halotolerans]|uniref:Uncharacterized protein n=1 Tax=Brevibacillus halotolerans TaxID=1507437 RepID=A0ABT4HXF1_9BACL|nr:hypothetical protein [Brevibacillus halotolerans]GIO03244.1 hypothetical protein J5TS2_39120 [Brevibacillus halotolerans]